MICIIEICTDETIMANEDFALVFGETPKKPHYFRHLENGKEFVCLEAGIAWSVYLKKPGVVVVVGASRDESPNYEIIEAVMGDSPQELMAQCFNLRKKYGFGEMEGLLQRFIGQDLFESMLRGLNKKHSQNLFFTKPADMESQNSDEIYIETIRNMSSAGKLIIPQQNIIDELKSLSITDAEQRLTDFPVAAAIGYVLHEMNVRKPWLGSGGKPIVVDY